MGKKRQHGRIGQSAIKVKITVILKLKKKNHLVPNHYDD